MSRNCIQRRQRQKAILRWDFSKKTSRQIMSDMEATLIEPNRIRDVSRAGELSDMDGKKRAGDAATLIMNLINQMGSSIDDEDGKSDNEN